MNEQELLTARVLIVDDESLNVELLEQMLGRWGYTNVVGVTHPRDALSLWTSFAPDIVLLDLMMPEMDGFAVMEQLRPLIPETSYLPILVLTGDTSAQTRMGALAAGAQDFLIKPFDAVELSLRVRNLLRTRFLHLNLSAQAQVLEARVQERTRDLEQAQMDAVACLALAAEFRDDATGQHTRRVGGIVALLARHLGLDEGRVALIERAAPLHDVGKIGVPDGILLKPGKVTAGEFAIIKRHAEIGARILSRHHSPLLQAAAEIALTHHERWDGGGYPRGLSGEAIPLEGRIVAIADVFDALTHERPYKAAWPAQQAVAEIEQQSARHFDPALVAIFLDLAANDAAPFRVNGASGGAGHGVAS